MIVYKYWVNNNYNVSKMKTTQSINFDEWIHDDVQNKGVQFAKNLCTLLNW